MNAVVLQTEKITKKFPGVVALKDVSFDLRLGEIHGLCGMCGGTQSSHDIGDTLDHHGK